MHNWDFAQDTAGAGGTTRDYLDHIRGEVLNSSPPLEARQIVLRAAEITRETGRNQAQSFSRNYPDMDAAALRTWCGSEGRAIVRGFMAGNGANHEKFLCELAEDKSTSCL